MKFPDGFPATRVELRYRSYPEVALGFEPRPDMKPTEYISPEDRRRRGKRADGGGEGGRENVPVRPLNGAEPVLEKREPQREKSEAEKAASAIEIGQPQAVAMQPSTTSPAASQQGVTIDGKTGEVLSPRPQPSGLPGARDAAMGGMGTAINLGRSGPEASDQNRAVEATRPSARGEAGPADTRQEEQVMRELRDGIGTESTKHHDRGHDHDNGLDDGYGMGD